MRASRRDFLGALSAGLGAGLLHGLSPWSPTQVSADDSPLPTGATTYHGLERPVRVLDTRQGLGPSAHRLSSDTMRLQVAGLAGIPAEAQALVATMTARTRDGSGFLTVWPSGRRRPEVSNLNFESADELIANLVTVRLGDDGSIDMYSDRQVDVIVDVAGCYLPVDVPVASGRLLLRDTPTRVLDTRSRGLPLPAGHAIDVMLGRSITPGSLGVLVNLTAVASGAAGQVSVGPLGDEQMPSTSNLCVNRPGETRAVAAMIALSGANPAGFTLWTSTTTHLLVDVMGSVSGPLVEPSTEGLFVPVTPRRLLDTRREGQLGRTWPSTLVECPVPGLAGTSVGGAVVNLTAVAARGAGYLSVLAARQPVARYQGVSHLNVDRRGQTATNHAVVRLARRGGMAVHTSQGAHVLVDLAGYLLGTPTPSLTSAPPRLSPPIAQPPWILESADLRLRSRVRQGDPDAVTDSGDTWHWTGTGGLGQRAHVVLFAHRTDAGGPFRRLHQLRDGAELHLTAEDGRVFTYKVASREITDDQPASILAATRRLDTTTVSLVACSRRDGTPTSLQYRLIVTAVLDRVTDD